jgi:hypothetical protein
MAGNDNSPGPTVPLREMQANQAADQARMRANEDSRNESTGRGSMARPGVIGSYKDPKARATQIEDKRSPDATPAKSLVEGVTNEMQRDVDEAKEPLEKAKSYEEILEENDISRSKATAIVDDLLTKGFYEEDIAITSTAYVTLRTRSHSDYRRYLRALEVNAPRYADEQNEIQMRYFIAASLVHFKGRGFEHPEQKIGNERAVETAFGERLSWIETQPERVIGLIALKLHKFDRMIQVVMSEGVIENF